MSAHYSQAPALRVSQWINTNQSIELAALRGRVVVVHAFQMLCPACVSHGLPQARALRELFTQGDVVVLGLHTVFEHHDVMTAAALRAFAHEYRLRFPIGIDMPSKSNPMPLTMRAYALEGTPSLMLIDRRGRLRLTHFGPMPDLEAGVLVGQLVAEESGAQALANDERQAPTPDNGCDDAGCPAPAP